jgi:hypothetical protein
MKSIITKWRISLIDLKFCIHSRIIKTKTTETLNKEKKISFEKESFLSQSDHVKSNLFNKNSKSMMIIKILFEKKLNLINQRLIFLEKTKSRRRYLLISQKILMQLKISDSTLMSSKSLIWRRRNHCSWWTSRW